MKKSQIKIGESVAVLMIFFVLVIVGIIFWSRYTQVEIKGQQETDVLSRAIKVSQTVTFLSELQCSTLEVIKFSCFDFYKINAVQDLLTNPSNHDENRTNYYFDIFGFSNITVHSIYPKDQSWNIYDNPGGNFTGYVSTQVPVSILDPINNTFSFGYVDVAVYTRRTA
jgi:hypothetical protein